MRDPSEQRPPESADETRVTGVLRVGDVLYRSSTGEVIDGVTVRRLRPQAAEAFRILLERPGELVARDTIIDRLWPHGAVEGDLGLNACIRQIRAGLGDQAGEPRFIETLRGRGYRLIAPVAPAEGGAAGTIGSVAGTPPVATSPRPGSWGPPGLRLLGVVGLALVVVFGSTLLITESPAVESEAYRLAVLPVGGIGEEPELEPYRAALTEDIITSLANRHPTRLVVVGRASVETLVARGLDGSAIARELGLDYVLTGTLRSLPRGRRLTVQLLDARSGGYVWSRAVDLRREELYGAHRAVSSGVLAALELDAVTEPLPASSAVVRTAVLRARYLRDRFTVEDSRRAVALLTEAMGPDSADAAGLIELARHQLILGELDAANRSLERARALDPDAAGLDHVAGRVALYGRADARAALPFLERAVTRRPGTAELHHDYAHALGAVGHLDRAAEHARVALELDPVSSVVLGDMGWVLYYAGEFREARQACAETRMLRPESLNARKCVVLAAAQEGALSEAMDDVDVLLRALGADEVERERLVASAVRGDDEAVWAWIAEREGGLEPVDRARALALLGRTDEAEAIVAKLPRGSVGAQFERRDPLFRGR